MTFLDGILQGIIQGITEFLPVSSDGHVSLYQHFTNNSGENALFFTLMLHLGTLLAVFIVYFKDIQDLVIEAFSMIADLFKGRLFKTKPNENRMMIYMLIVTTLPLFGFVFIESFLTSLAEDSDIIVEGFCFLYTATLLFLASKCVKGKKGVDELSIKDALIIGVFQGLAILPGVSRSGSTISVGLLKGYSKEFIVKFSFLLSIPAILGASVLKIPGAIKEGVSFELSVLFIGMLSACIVGLFSIKLIQYLVKNDKYQVFAYYTGILGILVLILGVMETFFGIYFII